MKDVNALAVETREWLAKAADDLGSSGALIASGYLANALFFCQQAAEKSLKAFLVWPSQPFRRTHDLEDLGRPCGVIDPTLEPLLEEADVLSDYAWKLRYPGSAFIPGPEEAAAMLDVAGKVFREVQLRLPREVRIDSIPGPQQL